ncbi:bifunctional [glutamine synthetase] adenylyltransferase/[glutamine synthetase]-adenylyl-L-tyrosine phosphorylase, partial [Rhizobiaceae sp. 2RAB30]
QDAWTWEHMALTRARPVAGDESLAQEIEDEVCQVLALQRDKAKIAKEASDMRALIEEEKPPRDLWDLKLVPGGLIDLEFIAQYATLTGQVTGERRLTGTADVLAHLDPAFADAQMRQELVEAHHLYSALTQIIRLCLTGAFERDDVPPGLADLLLGATDLPDFAVLEAHVEETSRKAREDFDRLLRGKRR